MILCNVFLVQKSGHICCVLGTKGLALWNALIWSTASDM